MKYFAPGLNKNLGSGWIMRAIDDGSLVPTLKTRRPLDVGKPTRDRRVVDLGLGCADCGNCDRGVEFLVFAAQRNRRFRVRLMDNLQWRLAFRSASADYFPGC